MSATPLKMAPFRYWGAKVKMAPWIIERLPAHDHFVEACAGSAAIMALKPPVSGETVNDVYGEVVNFFQVIRDPTLAADLIDRVAFTPYSRAEFVAAANIGDDATPVERATAFLVRMQMAVVPGESGWSYSLTGSSVKKANKPGRWAKMPEHLRSVAERFERVQVENLDVVDLMGRYDKPGVLFLIDPPYLSKSRGVNSAYVHGSFDHEALVDAIGAVEHASVAVTHYPTALYDDLDWTTVDDFVSYRNIPNGAGRDKKVERLYITVRP